jgi:8-oxo-dGTP diphosphatase
MCLILFEIKAKERWKESFMSHRDYPDHPRVGVGAVVLKEGRVLLVRRRVAPNCGLWAIPGGGLKLGETLREGAEREVLEETEIKIRAREQIYTGDLVDRDAEGRVRFHYVVIDFAADYVSGEVNGSDDALEARWVSSEELRGLSATETTLKIMRDLGFLPPPEPTATVYYYGSNI